MSANRETPIGGNPLDGPTTFNPLAPPPERQILPQEEGGPRLRSVATSEDLQKSPDVPRPTVAVPEDNTRLSDIIARQPKAKQAELMGLGPRIVVLWDFVKGKTKGNVVWASDLVGIELYRKADEGDEEARDFVSAELKRLVDLGAIREANREEGQFTQVVFPEGEQALTTTLAVEQQKRVQAESELERLRRIMLEAQIDPNTGERINVAPEGGDQGQQDPTPRPDEIVTTTGGTEGRTTPGGNLGDLPAL